MKDLKAMKTLVIPYALLLVLTFLQIFIESNIGNSLIKGLLIPFLSICTIVFVSWCAKDRSWVEKELYNKEGWWWVLLGVAGSILAVVLFHFLWNMTFVSYGYLPLRFHLKEFNIIVTLLIHLSFYCMIEELLFRGYFQVEVKKMSIHLPLSLSLFYQILIPTILFTLMHFFKMGVGCVLIIVPSLIFGFLKFYTKNIYAAIGAHLIFNLYHSSLMEAPF